MDAPGTTRLAEPAVTLLGADDVSSHVALANVVGRGAPTTPAGLCHRRQDRTFVCHDPIPKVRQAAGASCNKAKEHVGDVEGLKRALQR